MGLVHLYQVVDGDVDGGGAVVVADGFVSCVVDAVEELVVPYSCIHASDPS